MQRQQKKLNGIVDTERFSNHTRQYYFDIKRSRNQEYYLRITRRDQVEAELFTRREIIFFADDIGFMVEALAMLLGRYSAGELDISA
jgi:hypothetical protein